MNKQNLPDILVSMTELVSKFKKEIKGFNYNSIDSKNSDMASNFVKLSSYETFLKQPLTLSMFITVDSEGNVLEEPKEEDFNTGHTETDYNNFANNFNQYQKALENVLFEGKWNYTVDKNYTVDGRYYFMKWVYNGDINIALNDFKTIEDLVSYGLKIKK